MQPRYQTTQVQEPKKMTAGFIVEENNIVSAWSSAAMQLCKSQPAPNYLAVTAATNAPTSNAKLKLIDGCADAIHAERPGTVAEVLLPKCVMNSDGEMAERLEKGWRYFGRGRRRGLRFSGWRHTYFERLTGRSIRKNENLEEIKENRLRSIIEKANSWDLDVEAALYAHTDAPTDSLRTRGAPCLQYVQFRLYDGDKLETFALYRAHDYFHKALGNLVGLQRLGDFVADETQRHLTRTTVFSLHPSIGGTKQALRKYIDSVAELPEV